MQLERGEEEPAYRVIIPEENIAARKESSVHSAAFGAANVGETNERKSGAMPEKGPEG